jgi:hypothetical protein
MLNPCIRRRVAILVIAAFGALVFTSVASAAVMVTVTPNTSSWTQDDTRPGGTVTWTNQYGAPAGLGRGSLKLTSPQLDTAAKAGLYTHTMAGFPGSLRDHVGLLDVPGSDGSTESAAR